MGTNFYARRLPTEDESKLLRNQIEAFIKGDVIDPYPVSDCLDLFHIGKRSPGWQFIFQTNKNWEDNKLETIKKYLSRSDVVIFDEYDKKITCEDFWNNEIGESLYNDPKLYINLEQYWETHMREYIQKKAYHRDNEFTTDEGLRFCTDDFG